MDYGVGLHRMHPNPASPDSNHFERVTKLAFRIIVGGTSNEGTRGLCADHSSRLRTMDRELAAIRVLAIRQEPLVAANEPGLEPPLAGEEDGGQSGNESVRGNPLVRSCDSIG